MKKIFNILILMTIIVSMFGVVSANSIESSQIIFEGALTDDGDGSYSGTIDAVAGEYYIPGGDGTIACEEASGYCGPDGRNAVGGWDVYAKEGGDAFYDDVFQGVINETHDAYSGPGGWGSFWNPDVPDWEHYQLTFDGDNWYLEYKGTALGTPMSGKINWNNMYASEEDVGSYRGTVPADPDANDGGAAANGGGAQAWDMDWTWGSEVIPLEFPGFDVSIANLGGGDYKVTLTPQEGPVENQNTGETYATIQDAIDDASTGDVINVDSGEYAGAVINKKVKIIGAADRTSIITSGVPYKEGKDNLMSAFRPEADGAEIRNFDISDTIDLGIYAIEVDEITVDSITIRDTVQGISNWGGSDWTITNNIITDTIASGGGGIGIFLGAKAQQQCNNNLVKNNEIDATATADSYSTPGIFLGLDTRYGGYEELDGTEKVSGNQILDNVIMASGANNGVGIEVGTILGNSESDPDRTDPVKIDALMTASAVQDNLVEGNTINGAETGIYFYIVTDLTITQNDIKNVVEKGIYAEYAHSGIILNHNSLPSLTNNGVVELNAKRNWWGTAVFDQIKALITGLVSFDPWYSSSNMDTLTGETTVVGEEKVLSVDEEVTMETEDVVVEIPSGISIKGDKDDWDGTIKAPEIKVTATVEPTKEEGKITRVNKVIEVGFPDVKLVFDKAVKLVIPGEAGSKAGYSRSGEFTVITTTCGANSQSWANANLAEGEDCKIDAGADLVIWTKHFTEFIAYTTTTGCFVDSDCSYLDEASVCDGKKLKTVDGVCSAGVCAARVTSNCDEDCGCECLNGCPETKCEDKCIGINLYQYESTSVENECSEETCECTENKCELKNIISNYSECVEKAECLVDSDCNKISGYLCSGNSLFSSKGMCIGYKCTRTSIRSSEKITTCEEGCSRYWDNGWLYGKCNGVSKDTDEGCLGKSNGDECITTNLEDPSGTVPEGEEGICVEYKTGLVCDSGEISEDDSGVWQRDCTKSAGIFPTEIVSCFDGPRFTNQGICTQGGFCVQDEACQADVEHNGKVYEDVVVKSCANTYYSGENKGELKCPEMSPCDTDTSDGKFNPDGYCQNKVCVKA